MVNVEGEYKCSISVDYVVCAWVCMCVCNRLRSKEPVTVVECVWSQVWTGMEEENLTHLALWSVMMDGESPVRAAAINLVHQLFLSAKYRSVTHFNMFFSPYINSPVPY